MGHRTFMEAGKIKGNEILITTNHIFTGGVHIIAGRIGGPFGSGLPITIRLELSSPGLIIRPPVQYNPMITFHGIFTTPSMTMPLMPSSSDTIFPRLNALSPRLVIDPLFLMFLAMSSDGGVNAG